MALRLLHTTEALGCYPEMRLRITGDAWDHHAEIKLLEEFSGSTSACVAKRMVDVLGKDLASERRVQWEENQYINVRGKGEIQAGR